MVKTNKNLLKISVLTMSLVQQGTNGIAPILSDISAEFPDASDTVVQFLMTFPSIFCLVFVLLSALMAEKIPKKVLAVTGLAICGAGGVLAVLFHSSIAILYVWAGVIGIGIGMVAPLAPAVINESYNGQEHRTMLGWQNSASNVGSMIMTFACGYLAIAGWNFGYLVFLLGIPGIIFAILGMPSGKGRGISDDDNRISRGPFKLIIWREMLITLVFLALYSAVPANLAMLVAEKKLGDTSTAGIMSTLFLLAGFLMGLVFGILSRVFGRFTSMAGVLLLAAGAFLMGISSNIVLLAAGCLIAGTSMSMLMPSCMSAASLLKGYETINTALIMGCSFIGVFIAPLITTLTTALTGSTATAGRFIVDGCLAVILAGVTYILKAGKA